MFSERTFITVIRSNTHSNFLQCVSQVMSETWKTLNRILIFIYLKANLPALKKKKI